MASGGFSFGNTSSAAAPGGIGGGFGFGAQPNTAAATTTAQPATGVLGASTGFSLSSAAAAAAKPAGSVTFGTLQAAPTTATGFGGFGAAATPVTQAGTATGFQLGGVKATSSGFTLGAPTTTTGTSTIFGGGFGSTTAAKPTNLTLGVTPAITSSAAPTLGTSVGFSLGGTAAAGTTKSGLTLGALTTTTTSSSGFSLGGGLGGQTATTASSGGLFGGLAATSSAASSTSRGLGGVDPKTSQTGTGTGTANGKPSDNKAIKETSVPNEVCQTVEDFKKYVKEQKMTRENIARMSSKPMLKVQEEVASLQQLLSLVSNGLQRNTHAIDKLKAETAQELKHAEIAQRTKDTPPGLQYENTAPADYFQCLAEDFEVHMVIYRQQIEEMESHLASLHQASMFTPQELSILLSKLHESFISLAAQLQNVHEAVKIQKEHYLNYRKVFHGDSSNIFEKRKKMEEKTGSSIVTTTVGPTPFTGMSNAAAVAMATALNRTQQPAAAPTLGLGQTALGGSTGLLGGAQTGLAKPGTIFGTGTTAPASGFGSGFGNAFGSTATTTAQSGFNFGTPAPTQTAAVKPLGSSFGTATFGVATQQTNNAFGTSQFGTPSATLGAATGFGDSSFQLQKPPAGNKRGKR